MIRILPSVYLLIGFREVHASKIIGHVVTHIMLCVDACSSDFFLIPFNDKGGVILDHGLCLAWIHVSVSILLGWWSVSHCV